MRRAQGGFTLIEMMTVVAVIAILATLLIGMSVRPYSANVGAVAEQASGTLAFARMRAVATRKVHRVQFLIDTNGEPYMIVDAAPSPGMQIPTSGWLMVQYTRMPKAVMLWSAAAGAQATPTGATPTEGGGLPYNVYFKPDGTATASTIYLRDRAGSVHYYRVYIYQATGSSYVRESW